MGRCLVKQPDGNFAVWSTYVDDFIYRDKTQAELIEALAQDAYDEEVVRLNRIFEKPNTNMSKMAFKDYAECMETWEWRHGENKGKGEDEEEEIS